MGNPIKSRFSICRQRFRFYNVTKCMPNKYGLVSNYCLPWACGLDENGNQENIVIFEQVIRENWREGWDMSDYVIAVGENETVFRYYRKTINQCIPTPAEMQIEIMVGDLFKALLDEMPLHQILPY